jgi:hypothetical protein
MAQEVYPHPQWAHLDAIWRSLYPVSRLGQASERTLRDLERTMPALARLISEHRPRLMGGYTLREVLTCPCLSPPKLLASYEQWRRDPSRAFADRPCRALAVLGQAKVSNRLGAAQETRALEQLLTSWALRRARNETKACARAAA